MFLSQITITNKIFKEFLGYIAVILLLGLSAYSWLFYSGRINTYQIITITSRDSSAINCKAYGISPFGRKIPFTRTNTFTLYQYYSFFREIKIEFDEKNKNSAHDLVFDIGNTRYHYLISGNKSFTKPEADRGIVTFWKSLLSVRHWTLVRRGFLILLILIGVLSVYFIISGLRKWEKTLKDHKIIKNKTRRIIFTMKAWIMRLGGVIASVVVIVWMTFNLTVEKSEVSTAVLFLFMTLYLLGLYIMLRKLIMLFTEKRIIFQKNMITLISSLFITVFAVETILRISGITATYPEKRSHYYSSPYLPQDRGWLHIRPANDVIRLKTPEYEFERRTNSLGLSDIEHPVAKDSNEFRIIGIGDSFTEGDGADKDSTWIKFLERSLRKQNPERKLRFMNAGVCGSDPFFEYILLRDKLLKYKPDLVILAINDEIIDIIVRGGMERFKADGTLMFLKAPGWEWIFSVSHIFRLIVRNALHYDHLLISPWEYSKRFETAFKQLNESMLLFKTLSEKEGFKLLVVVHPMKMEIHKKKYQYLDKTLEFAKKNGMETMDMLSYFIHQENISAENAGNYFWKYDGHHNARGYAAFARGVEWKLKQRGILNTLRKK